MSVRDECVAKARLKSSGLLTLLTTLTINSLRCLQAIGNNDVYEQLPSEVCAVIKTWCSSLSCADDECSSAIISYSLKTDFKKAVLSCIDGAIFDIKFVVYKLGQLLRSRISTNNLDQKIRIVNSILSCEVLSLAHLLCSPGGAAIIDIIFYVAAVVHPDCANLQSCSIKTLINLADRVSST